MFMLMLALVGCVSIRNLQTAAPLGKGQSEVGVDAGYVILVDPETGEQAQGLPPFVNVSFRHGVSERTDILIEGSSNVGVGFGIKGTLTNPESNGVQVALAPRVAVSTQIVTSSLQASLPVLVGIPLGPHELTLGPRVDWWTGSLITEQLGSLRSVSVGGSASLALQLGQVRLIPEFTLTRPAFGSARLIDETTGGSIASDSPWWIQPNLAILIGTSSPSKD